MRDGVPKVPKIESFRVLPGKNGVNGSKPVVEPAKATVNGHGHTPAETANGSKSMNGVHGKRGVKRTFEAINNINNLNTAKQTNGAESIVAPSIVQPKRSQDLFLEQNLPDLDGEVSRGISILPSTRNEHILIPWFPLGLTGSIHLPQLFALQRREGPTH